MTEELQYIGCGAVIQTNRPGELEYTPQTASEKGLVSGEVYRQRCFRLCHYNEIQDVLLADDGFLRLLNELGQKGALIVNVVDILDSSGSLIPGLYRFVGDNPVLLVGNKVDISPKSLKKTELTQWMKERAYKAGIRPVDVLLTNAKRSHKMTELLERIEEYRDGRDVYIVGVTNVGKSTFTSQIIKNTAEVQDVVTTSQFPGTILGKIEISLDDGHFLIDTLGIIHRHQMAYYLGKKDLRIIAPLKEIKPRVYQLNERQTPFLDGLTRFDFISDNRASFIAYVSNDVNIHRTKLERTDKFYQKHVGGLLQPPRSDRVEALPELVRFEFSVKEETDVVLVGLGQITVTAPVVITGWALKGVGVLKRKALI